MRDLEKIFKKAHMEIASQMSRIIGDRRQDGGAGLGAFLQGEAWHTSDYFQGNLASSLFPFIFLCFPWFIKIRLNGLHQ